MHIQLYLISFLEIILPIAALIVLMKFHKFRFAAIIGGIAAYFLATSIVMPLITMMLSAIGMNELYWQVHEKGYQITNIILNTILQDVALYLLLKFTLKNRARIYDAMALGISYWLSDGFRYAMSNVTYARIYQMYSAGRLSEMLGDGVTMDMLQSAVDDVNASGIGVYYVQFVALVSMILVSIALCLFLYLAVKRKSLKYLFMTFGIHFGSMVLVNLPLIWNHYELYAVTSALAFVAAAVLIWRFMVWYREKQRALAYRRKNYQESQKSSEEA